MADWLPDAGLEPVVIRPHAGESVPDDVGVHDAVIALGGGRDVEWATDLGRLLRAMVAQQLPTLAFCSSARALATGFGGQTTPVERFNPGPRLAARRDAADRDSLFATAPMAMDVIWWRHEELSALPPEALPLATSPHGVPEIFRIGERAWGIQSHIELDGDMVKDLGGEDELARRVDSVGQYLTDTWQPIINRFAGLTQGRTAGAPLPLFEA
ncbi:MAG: type 1 glutamine amidotransferase [Stackebrandtia sp.]